jgi:hypothetical protein
MRRVIILTAVVSSLALAGAAPAFAESPWWHLGSSARPTYLQKLPGARPVKDEVLELAENGTGGVILLEKNPGLGDAVSGNDIVFNYNASAKQVQEAFEIEEGIVPVYGHGNVEVTGGPKEENQLVVSKDEPYFIKFKGALAGQTVASPALTPGDPTGFVGELMVTRVAEPQSGHPDGVVVATVLNVGDAPAAECVKVATGSGKYNEGCTSKASPPGSGGFEKEPPVRIVDRLPAGVEALSVEGAAATPGGLALPLTSCSLESEHAGEPPVAVCTLPSAAPFQTIETRVSVFVKGEVPEHAVNESEVNEVSVSGGGALAARVRRPLQLSQEKVPFGEEDYELTPEEEGGALDTQAGSHPFQTTFTVAVNQDAEGVSSFGQAVIPLPAGQTRDVNAELPPGLIGNPQGPARCTVQQFLASNCPAASVVGVAVSTFSEPNFLGLLSPAKPVFNLDPATGEPALFGWLPTNNENPQYIKTSVRTGGDYGIDADDHSITQTITFTSNIITLWGVPGDSRHNQTRGECLHGPCEPFSQNNSQPFFELPTSCTGPLQTSIAVDSWEEPGVFKSRSGRSEPALDGCDRLPFEPSLDVEPDGHAASTPTGLAIHQHIDQETSLNPNGLGASDVKGVTVTFPEGVVINPAGADGLEACSEGLVGYLPGESTPPEDLHFTGKLPGSFGSGERLEPGIDFCSNASKIGTVRIKTPVLPNDLEGALYLASQNANPFGSLVAVYIVAEDPVSGVLVKLPGEISLNQQTGQVVATFLNIPQAPFEEAEFHLFGGERAPLATPPHCGTYVTKVQFTPWSGNGPVTTESPFEITSGPNNSACPGSSLPFSPELTSGTTNNQAGGFSPFTLTMTRQDGNQNLKSIELHMPDGVSGILAGVPLCGEEQANAGTCPPASLIGETIVSVGLGGDPFSVKGGKVYITGPYKGAPFGLSIVNPAVAGPFNLGDVVVRAKIEVNPTTAALTVASDSSGPYAIPPSLDGIPLEIKHVNVTIGRPGFTFNPTNCSPQAITGTLQSIEGSAEALSVPFQATNCAALKFEPKVAVSTSGKTSRTGGASLTLKISKPDTQVDTQGVQANIAKFKVELPKQLPSRLTTLQKACTEAQFNANPAGCPAPSIVGHMKVTTPELPVELEGPMYFVSHGGEAFPDLEVVLQGYGVTVILTGNTFISKAGITSSTFNAIPDAPFAGAEVTLPEGPYSALAANGDLCKSKLTMPTAIVGQNGAEIHADNPISVTGCAKTKTVAPTRAQRLAKALKACRKDRLRSKRAACARQARRKYGAAKKKAKKK